LDPLPPWDSDEWAEVTAGCRERRGQGAIEIVTSETFRGREDGIVKCKERKGERDVGRIEIGRLGEWVLSCEDGERGGILED
jgi:hypothetical protein